MPELLVPAGNLEKLEYALTYGADAVYIGGSRFSLRQGAPNFSLPQVETARRLTKKAKKKLYIALNIFAHQYDMDDLADFMEGLRAIKPDALIISDPGVIKTAKRICSDISLHISTQANVTNLEAVNFWADLGAARVTLARELSLGEIKDISKKAKIETEVFVHGAMCLSYSGRCWLSSYLSQRDANKGDCSQSCRWNYALVEEQRADEAFEVFEDNRGSYILSSKDLCLAEEIEKLVEAGVSSFKIEGRMKSVHYIATTTKTYRQIIDKTLDGNNKFVFEKKWLDELSKISHRQYSKGFLGENSKDLQVKGKTSYLKTAQFLGTVEEQTSTGVKVKVKNRLQKGDKLDVLIPGGDNIKAQAMFYDNEGQLAQVAHPNAIVWFKEKWPAKSLIRRKIADD